MRNSVQIWTSSAGVEQRVKTPRLKHKYLLNKSTSTENHRSYLLSISARNVRPVEHRDRYLNQRNLLPKAGFR